MLPPSFISSKPANYRLINSPVRKLLSKSNPLPASIYLLPRLAEIILSIIPPQILLLAELETCDTPNTELHSVHDSVLLPPYLYLSLIDSYSRLTLLLPQCRSNNSNQHVRHRPSLTSRPDSHRLHSGPVRKRAPVLSAPISPPGIQPCREPSTLSFPITFASSSSYTHCSRGG